MNKNIHIIGGLIGMLLTISPPVHSNYHRHDLSSSIARKIAVFSVAAGATCFIASLWKKPRNRSVAGVSALAATIGAAYLAYARKYRVAYDPRVTHLKKPDGTNNSATIHLTGWGDNKNAVIRYELVDALPGTVVTFNLPDCPPDDNQVGRNTIANSTRLITRTCWGQIHEVLVTARILKDTIQKANPDRLYLYGHSRGGGLAVNTVAVLKEARDQAGLYRTYLNNLGISHTDCADILTRIEQGGMILDCPLGNVNNVLAQRIPLPQTAALSLVQLVSRYQRNGLQADLCAQTLHGLKLNTLLFFSRHDTMTGGREENKCLCDALLACNPTTTYIYEENVDGPLGGHIHDKERLKEHLAQFLRQTS